MNVRKLMAVITAAAMVLSPMTALADDVTSNNTTSGAIEGSGSVEYVTSDVYSVVLPTSSQLGVYLDPQGLSTISNNDPVTLGDLASHAGKIVPRGTALIKNKSSIPVKVSTKMYVNTTSSAVKMLSSTSVNSGSAENVYLYAGSSANKIVDASGNDSNGNAFVSDISGNGNLNITATSSGAANTMAFVLGAANYNVNKTTVNGKNSYSLVYDVSDNNFDSAAFQFGGLVNKNADWSEFNGVSPKTFGIDTVYTITGMTSSDYSTAIGAKITGTYNQVTAAAATDDYKMVSNGSGGYQYTFKSSTPTGSITAITIDGTSRIGAVTGGNITYSAGVLSFNSTFTSAVLTTSGSHTVNVTIGSTPYTLTVTI